MAVTEIDLAEALVRLSHHVAYVFAEVSRAHGLTPQQAQLLCMLGEGPIGPTELSRQLRMEKSSLTGLVDRVQRRGLVAREPHQHDRRACQISLSAKGSELAKRTHVEVCRRLDELADELPPGQREALTEIIDRLLS